MQLFLLKHWYAHINLGKGSFSPCRSFIVPNDLQTHHSVSLPFFQLIFIFDDPMLILFTMFSFSFGIKKLSLLRIIKGYSKLTDRSQESPSASSGEEAQGLSHFNMKNTAFDRAVGLPIRSIRYVSDISRNSSAFETSHCKQSKITFLILHEVSLFSFSLRNSKEVLGNAEVDSPIAWMSRFSKRADSYVKGIKDHGMFNFSK